MPAAAVASGKCRHVMVCLPVKPGVAWCLTGGSEGRVASSQPGGMTEETGPSQQGHQVDPEDPIYQAMMAAAKAPPPQPAVKAESKRERSVERPQANGVAQDRSVLLVSRFLTKLMSLWLRSECGGCTTVPFYLPPGLCVCDSQCVCECVCPGVFLLGVGCRPSAPRG
jgi:hypothetical protein